jgi:16S rRNA (uracil1498-N3)-methyltransferase
MSLPRFFAPAAAAGGADVELPPDEAHHLRDVLRLGPGAVVRVFDGAGSEWHARVARADRRGVTVSLVERLAALPEPPVRLTLGVGLLKGSAMDAVIRDATMMGADVVVPLATAHVAVSGAARQNAAVVGRWTRVALASAKQCGRAVVPLVEPVAELDSVLARPGYDVIVMSVEPSQAAAAGPGGGADLTQPPGGSALVLVGPEGGWSEDEVARALARGARLMTLGPRTIRAESAPAVLLSSLWTEWGWD